MPELPPQPKTPEMLQAQLAAFATERQTNNSYENNIRITQNIGELAAGEAVDLVHTAIADEYDHNGRRLTLAEGDSMLVATAKEYIGFLRERGGQHDELIKGRTTLLEDFKDFAPDIAKLKAEIAEADKSGKQHPNFLGSGNNSGVYRMNHEGKDYAVRMLQREAHDQAYMVDFHMAGGVLGKDVPGLEQMKAASYEEAMTISELMPGKEMSKLTAEEIRQIKPEHLRGLAQTLTEAGRRGLFLDHHAGNLLYDAEAGFGVIDYIVPPAGERPHPIGRVVGEVDLSLYSAGEHNFSDEDGELAPEDVAYQIELAQTNLELLNKYKTAITEVVPKVEQDVAITQIDDSIWYLGTRVDGLQAQSAKAAVKH